MLYRLRALLLILITILLLPLLSVVCLTILFFNILYLFAGLTRKSIPSEAPPKSGLASIVVLNWNGKDLLAQGLPSILEAVRVDGRPHEVLVVDNGSTDGSLEFLKECFPEVRILALKENLGFAQGNNAGVRAAQNDIVVLLNNDMVVDPGFLGPLLRGFGPRHFCRFQPDLSPGCSKEERGNRQNHCRLQTGNDRLCPPRNRPPALSEKPLSGVLGRGRLVGISSGKISRSWRIPGHLLPGLCGRHGSFFPGLASRLGSAFGPRFRCLPQAPSINRAPFQPIQASIPDYTQSIHLPLEKYT